MVDFPELTA